MISPLHVALTSSVDRVCPVYLGKWYRYEILDMKADDGDLIASLILFAKVSRVRHALRGCLRDVKALRQPGTEA